MQCGPNRSCTGVRPEVLAFFALWSPVEAQLGPFVIAREVDIGIGLVVLEIAVIRRAILFDQVMLEQQGIAFGGGDSDLNIVNSSH